MLLPPSYEVAAALLVSRARAEVPLAPTDSAQAVAHGVTEAELNSEVEILRSRMLIEEVLGIIGVPDSRQRESSRWLGLVTRVKSTLTSAVQRNGLPPADRLLVRLQRDLKVGAIRRSNVIRVGLVSGDPNWATRFVQALVERYIERRVERYQSEQVVAFFEAQTNGAEERLRQSESALEAFLGSAGFTITKGPRGTDALSGQKSLLLNRMAGLRDELSKAETQAQEQSITAANLRGRLAAEPERLASSDRSFRGPEGEIIEQRLAELQLERDALLQDFKPDSRYVRDIDAQIELAEERLKQVRAYEGTIDGTEANPIHQELKGELLRAEIDLAAARARYSSISEQLRQIQTDLDTVNAKALAVENLQREAQAAEEEYLLYRKKLEEARISAAMDQQKLINVTIAQPAERPLVPIGRGIKTTAVIGLLSGLLGGLCLAFGIELYLDRSFTTGEDMERRIGLVHLASIPEEL
jgi:uncharacterized protein involved in exopolysaccharide biosynthesis